MQRSDSLYIDGKWRSASNGATFTVINPATEEPLGQMASATEQDVDAAIAAAQRGFEVWRKVQPWERAKLIRRVGDLVREREADIAEGPHPRGRQAAGPGQGRGADRRPSSSSGSPRRPSASTARRSRRRAGNGRIIVDLPAGRRGRRLRGLELSGRAGGPQDRAGAGGRLLHHLPARGRGADLGRPDRAVLPRCRPAAGRGRPADRRHQRHLAAHHGLAGGAQGHADRLGAGRQARC